MYADACPSVITYQWNFNGVPIFDATGSTLTLTNVTGAAAGQYDVTVQQTAGGPEDWQQVESDPATLTVITGPSAPAVVTEAASPVEYTVAGLNGTILPNGLDTTYWFTGNRYNLRPEHRSERGYRRQHLAGKCPGRD